MRLVDASTRFDASALRYSCCGTLYPSLPFLGERRVGSRNAASSLLRNTKRNGVRHRCTIDANRSEKGVACSSQKIDPAMSRKQQTISQYRSLHKDAKAYESSCSDNPNGGVLERIQTGLNLSTCMLTCLYACSLRARLDNCEIAPLVVCYAGYVRRSWLLEEKNLFAENSTSSM